MTIDADKPAAEETTTYKTCDLYFSAFLCAIDIPMITTETDASEGNRKIVFVFRVPRKDFDRIKASYFGGSGTVKVQKYVQALRSLKSLCFV
jgi:hypothetical protein